MESPVVRLRQSIEAWHRHQSVARLRGWWSGAAVQGPEHQESGPAPTPFLTGPGALEALREVTRLGLLSEAEDGAMRAHVARARADVALVGAREALRCLAERSVAVGRDVVPIWSASGEVLTEPNAERRAELAQVIDAAATSVLPELADGRALADAAAWPALEDGPMNPDAGPKRETVTGLAEDLLSTTDSAAEEHLRMLVPRHGAREASFDDLLHALRAPREDARWPAVGRWRRVAGVVEHLALESSYSQRLRAEESHGGMGPRVRVLPLRVPLDIRLGPSRLELGLASELCAAEGFGRGLAHTLISPALPVELRRPVAGTVARAMGGLFAQLLADPVFLRRGRGLAEAEARAVARHTAALLLMETRVHAAAFIARAEPSYAARVARGREALARALGLPVPVAFSAMVVATPAALGPRLRGRLGALGLAVALRDRLDEDWFRNPRAEEVLRAGCEPGGALSIEGFLSGLGGAPSHAAGRCLELASPLA